MSFSDDVHMISDLSKLKNVFDYDIAIEIISISAYNSSSTEFLKKTFKKVYTYELNKIEYNKRQIFKMDENHILGNSPDCLKKWFAEIGHDRFFIYFNASWGNGWEILDTLKELIHFSYEPVIIIENFDVNVADLKYNCNGDECLNLEYIESYLEQMYGKIGYGIMCNRVSEIGKGCIYIYPIDYISNNKSNELESDLYYLKYKINTL